jgi:hypothetical protein
MALICHTYADPFCRSPLFWLCRRNDAAAVCHYWPGMPPVQYARGFLRWKTKRMTKWRTAGCMFTCGKNARKFILILFTAGGALQAEKGISLTLGT